MTTVSRTCQCRKWTRIAVLFAARPGHPSTGQLRGPPLEGKAMRYVRGSSPVAEVVQLHLSSAARPCCSSGYLLTLLDSSCSYMLVSSISIISFFFVLGITIHDIDLVEHKPDEPGITLLYSLVA